MWFRGICLFCSLLVPGSVMSLGLEQRKALSVQIASENPTDALPDVQPAQVKDAYYRALVKELEGLHPKRLLLEADPTATYRGFSFDSREGRAIKEDTPIEKMPFARGWEIRTEKKPQEDMTHLARFERLPLRKGDLLYLTAWVRAEALPEGNEAGMVRFTASLRLPNATKKETLLLNTMFAVPEEEWKRVHFVMTLPRDPNPNTEELKLQFSFGGAEQTVQIGGIALIQFGAKTKAAAVWKRVAEKPKAER